MSPGIYSEAMPLQGAVILAGAAYFLFVFRGDFLRLIFFDDYLLALAILVVPILLMLLSDRSFERGEYTSRIAVAIDIRRCIRADIATRTQPDPGSSLPLQSWPLVRH